jgi:hypothetical protein
LTSSEEVRIDAINLFLINVTKEQNFGFGVWKNRQHVMINIKGGDQIGWGETKVANNQPDFDLSPWSEEFKKLKGMKLVEAPEKPQEQDAFLKCILEKATYLDK